MNEFPIACETTRQVIERNVSWLNNTDVILAPEDAGYEAQQNELDTALGAAHKAFNSRPDSCKMVEDGEDCYECQRCTFSADVFTG